MFAMSWATLGFSVSMSIGGLYGLGIFCASRFLLTVWGESDRVLLIDRVCEIKACRTARGIFLSINILCVAHFYFFVLFGTQQKIDKKKERLRQTTAY